MKHTIIAALLTVACASAYAGTVQDMLAQCAAVEKQILGTEPTGWGEINKVTRCISTMDGATEGVRTLAAVHKIPLCGEPASLGAMVVAWLRVVRTGPEVWTDDAAMSMSAFYILKTKCAAPAKPPIKAM